MSNYKQAHAVNLLNATLIPGAAVAITGPIKVRQMSVTPTESAPGTELSGSGFTVGGVAVAWNAPVAATGVYSATCGNQALTITSAPAGTVNGVLIVDSNATARELMWAPLATARTLVAGDTLSYPANSLVAST